MEASIGQNPQGEPEGRRVEAVRDFQMLRQTGARAESIKALLSPELRDQLLEGRPLDRPLYLEVHPYHNSQEMPCNNACPHCTKGDDKHDLRGERVTGIEPQRLQVLIQNLAAAGVELVILSGNSTEPLLYPRIAEVIGAIKDAKMQLRLYSNFYHGERLMEVLPRLDAGDYLRVSLDAGSAESYRISHCPRDPGAFDVILENIRRAVAAREKLGAGFSINITYLLTSQNSRPEEIEFIVAWARSSGVDSVRFNAPLKPAGGASQFRDGILPGEAQRGEALAVLAELKRRYADYAGRIITADDEPVQGAKPFTDCHHWKLVAVLGATGRFFPCTSVSLVKLAAALGRGDINDPAFDFWKFWRDREKWKKIRPAACALGAPMECTRFEFAVNKHIEQGRQ